ncbi:protein of unknown function DUF488 [Acidithiobacillus ferrivorans SS3]|uniref:Uroporphyrin-III C-methyltransferase n=1 Tax=Acidithiobacillus ferrivorans SS3 TaxID=743299 RepID=G0JMQ8_9PROT|nr:DUF488 family protein [Acidithiobacillus ferrivorans]AEM48191.1 protein of unknown function DUF488 [Acidithiobacillus ferrivorans SS3]
MNEQGHKMTPDCPLHIEITTWRVYERPLPTGYHVLAERLWPRGVRKADLALDAWPKDLTPSTALRQWFAHDPEHWDEFRSRYLAELATQKAGALTLLAAAAGTPIILLYAAHDQEHNGALVLRDFLQTLAEPTPDAP